MKNLFFYLLMTTTFLFINCKSGNDGVLNNENVGSNEIVVENGVHPNLNMEMGWIELNVSGAIEGKYEGVVDFYGESLSGMNYWSISGHDYKPNTFSLNFILTSFEELDQPGPGQYTIGYEPNSKEIFSGIFTQIFEGGKEFAEYSTFSSGGTLTLEKSDSNEVSGSFDFTAKHIETEVAVQVSGKFKAFPRLD